MGEGGERREEGKDRKLTSPAPRHRTNHTPTQRFEEIIRARDKAESVSGGYCAFFGTGGTERTEMEVCEEVGEFKELFLGEENI